MTPAISDTIKKKFDVLTPSQKRIAEYVLTNWDAVAFMVAKQLGQATQSSDAAVIRFSQALGFQGFMELRAAMRGELIARAGSMRIARPTPKTSKARDIFQESFRLDSSLLEATKRLNSPTTFCSVARKIVAAERVWVAAHGTTYPIGAYLAMHLNQALGKGETLTIGAGDTANRLRLIGGRDLVIGIGYVRYLPYTIEILRVSRERGATIVAITDSSISPLARLAGDVFLIARDGVSFAWSQIGTMAIANVIIAQAANEGGARTLKLLAESDKLWAELGHWRGSVEIGAALSHSTGGRHHSIRHWQG
jgi:DNA-binding MurR/RpiR family transcriptional regulator